MYNAYVLSNMIHKNDVEFLFILCPAPQVVEFHVCSLMSTCEVEVSWSIPLQPNDVIIFMTLFVKLSLSTHVVFCKISF